MEPGVQRIENQVAALGRVELAHEIHRRIVDDGAVAALLTCRRICRIADDLSVPVSPMSRMLLDSRRLGIA